MLGQISSKTSITIIITIKNKAIMKTKTINLDVEYASQALETIPVGYINKTICGCGLTTVAIENNENVIIAVPTIQLITNKVAQYPNERCSHEVFAVQGGTTKEDIIDYVMRTKVIKIMVTYDSLNKVEFLLESRCRLIIDESNKLLSSVQLKSESKRGNVDVINKLFNIAEKHKDNVSFISATPIPVEYLPEWVSSIEQVKINWKNTVKVKPLLMRRQSVIKAVGTEIISQLEKKGETVLEDVKFKKAIIFVNSLTKILKIIRTNKLNPEDIGIICGSSLDNDTKIKGFNRVTNPSNLTKYTFITSSGFEGIDLYDKEAVSIVLASTSAKYTMIDMLTDLKQAISRQRDKSNPNYAKFIYIYNQSMFDKSEEDLLDDLNSNYDSIKFGINTYNPRLQLVDGYEQIMKRIKHDKEFLAYTNYDETTNQFVMNENLFNSDKYFITTIRKQYNNGFDVSSEFEDSTTIKKGSLVKEVEIITYKKLIELYESGNNINDYSHSRYYQLIVDSIKHYGKVFKSYMYAKQMVENVGNDMGQIETMIRHRFKVGTDYTSTSIKAELKNIYESIGIKRAGKATDLGQFFMIQACKINIPGDKQQRGYRIIRNK